MLLCLPSQASDAYPFRVESWPENGGAAVVAINDGPSEIMANVYLEGENIVSNRPFPVRVVVPPGASLRIGRVSIANSALASKHLVRASYQIPSSPMADNIAVRQMPWNLLFRPSWYHWLLSFVGLTLVLRWFHRWSGRSKARRKPAQRNDYIYNPKEFRSSNRWPRS